MSAARKELQQALCRYASETLTCIYMVRRFSEMFSKWMIWRETELDMMIDIKNRADEIKNQKFFDYVKNLFSRQSAETRRNELQKELGEVVNDTLEGLEELDCFLEALERLAVTSLHVFTENQVLHLPEKLGLDYVQAVITAARLVCPLLLEFKRNAEIFFLPKLQNVEVLAYQLDRYIKTSKSICEKMQKSCFSDFSPERTEQAVVELSEDLSEDDIQRMHDHINQLHDIRADQNFRMVFLFQEESCDGFIKEFNERQPRMLDFLNELEELAVQLDRMCKGAKISSVAGSSVGAVGGVLSIVGLALMPVTAGVSLGLTMAGVGLGVTSGVNSIVTTATEVGVNHTRQKKAGEVFQSFMEDVTKIQDCLDEVTRQAASKMEADAKSVAVGIGKVIFKAGAVGKSIDSIVDLASAAKLLKNEELVASAGKVIAQEGKAIGSIPRVASDIPDVGQAAAKGSLVASQTARASFIALNALFLGMDIFFICKDSIGLSRGSETEFSQFLRARAALWCSEIDSWGKIQRSLTEGLQRSGKKEAVLETPFYHLMT